MDGHRPIIASRAGVVAAAHPLAAAAGAHILERGGNAFDAAVATAAALGVVEPFMSGLAGLGMATCWVAGDQRIRTLNFRTAVPAGFPLGRYSRREELALGAMAAAPPGNLAGWYDLISAHGTRTFAQALAPAIALARDGFPLLEFNTASINAAADLLRGQPFFGAWSATYTAGRGSVRQGQVLRQPDLAATLEAIAADGPKHLYGGPLGHRLVEHVQSLGACMTMADLEAVSPAWGKPVSAAYRDLVVHVPRPPSQAFQLLLTLRILDGFELAGMECNGAAHLDTVWRAIRLAAMRRIAHDNPSEEELDRLCDDETVGGLRERVADRAPIEGQVEQWQAPDPAPAGPAEQHTTSLSVADRAGNLVCLTQSLGGKFGCGVVVPGTGVCLNNALYWREDDPRATNTLVPGRTLTTPMAPSIATREGAPVLALGTPGSYGICQTQAQAMVQYVDFALPLQEAIEAPRARLWDGRRVTAESRIGAAILDELRERGHVIEAPEAWTMLVGGMQAVAIDPRTRVAIGAADPRRDGYVAAA
jgi:gamma-glutamyltranspeptidase/glutathione hydrolase